MATGTPDAALSLATGALAAAPAGILLDLDGTLAPIAAVPDAARPLPGVTASLAALAQRLAVVGIVTGRAAADARRILGPGARALLVIGNHGLEWLAPGATEGTWSPRLEPARAAVRDAVGALGELGEGVVVEDKGLSATIHYRGAPDPGAAERRLLSLAAPLAGGTLELRRGRMSLELRPAGLGDKGSALREVVARHALRGLVVAGDDVTDLDMFRVAGELRAAGTLRSAVIAVGGGREVPPAVAAAADVVLDSPAAMAALLVRLRAALSAG